MVARRAHNPEVVRFKSHPRNQKRKAVPCGLLSLFSLRSATCAYVLRVMPTSVARWVNEAKTPRGGVFGEVKSSAQGNEGEGYAPTRIDYAAGRARSDNPEVVRFKSHPRNQITKAHPCGALLLFRLRSGLPTTTSGRSEATAEGVGERGKRAQWALLPRRYPIKQGVEGAIYDCNAQRPCDWGGPTNPTPATK